MFPQAFAHFECQVQTGKIRIRRLEQLHHAHALLVMIEPALIAHTFGQHFLAGMSERCVPQVVGECDGFREIFVQP